MEFSLFKEEFKHIIKTETDPSEINQKQNDPPLMSCKIENDTFYPHFLSNDQVEILDSAKPHYENKDEFEYTYSLKMDVKSESNSNIYYTKYVEKDKVLYHGFKCDLCNLLLLDKSKLYIHCKSHVDQREIQMTTYTGGKYTSTISNDFDYTSLKKGDFKFYNGIKSKINPYRCDLCNKKLPDKRSVENHIESVHNQMMFHKCPLCDYKCSRRSYLRIHIDSVHNKIKSHQCHLCDYKCSGSSDLKRHIDSVHKKIKSHLCHLCDFKFSRRGYLKRHIDSVHNKIKSHQCHLCDYKCTQSNNLKVHIDSVHNSNKL